MSFAAIGESSLDPVPRTFDEDEQSFEAEPKFMVQPPVGKWSSEGATKVDTLIFAMTAEASCFLRCVKPAGTQPSGSVEVEGHGSWSFELADGVMYALCGVGAVAPPEISWLFLDRLLEGVDFDRAIILHSGHFAQFVTGNPHLVEDGEMSALRHMSTDRFEGADAICPALESPNVLDGVPAALLTHCQTTATPGAIFTCIQTEREAGVEMLRRFDPVVKQVGLTAPTDDAIYEANIGDMLVKDGLMVYT